MKLADVIKEFISGDWGNEIATEETPNAVNCVRGADIMPISNHQFSEIPQRYISDKSFSSKSLQVGDLIIEKSGGSPVQSTGRIVYVSEDLLYEKDNIVCSNFCTAIRVKPEWNPLYIYYFWLNVYNAGAFFNFEGKTSGLKNLQLDNALSAIEIAEVPFEEQNKIASTLAKIEHKMNINRAINHNLPTLDRSSGAVAVCRAA